MRRRFFYAAWAVALVAAVVVPVSLYANSGDSLPVAASAVAEGYFKIESTTTAYREAGASGARAISGADSADVSGRTTVVSIAGVASFNVMRQQTLEVSGRFSNASATCVITVCRYYWDGSTLTLQSTSNGTLTADASLTDTDGDYVAPALYFDTGASNLVKIRVAAASAGTLDKLFVRNP